jgi:hypothetical protein
MNEFGSIDGQTNLYVIIVGKTLALSKTSLQNACQADWFLHDRKKEKFSCPVFVKEKQPSTVRKWNCEKPEPMCAAARKHPTCYLG